MRKILKNRNFTLLWLALTVSGMGNWINFIALNLYVHSTFNSGKILGIFMMARMLPALFFGSLGGYLADRYSRRTIMITCDLLRALMVLGFIFSKNIYIFFILGITISALDRIFVAANSSFIPNIVKKEEIMEANSFIRMSLSLITILGCASGGIIFASFPISRVFIIDSLTFVFSVVSIALIKGYAEIKSEGHKKPGLIASFREAYSFFKSRPSLVFLVAIRLIDAMCSGSYNTSLPLYSKTLNTGSAYGWLIGIWSAGEFTGAFTVKAISKKIKISPEKLFTGALIIMAAGMGATFHFKTIYPALITIFIGGLCDGVANILFSTVMMKETPDQLRGKVLGTITSLVITTVSLGMAGAGAFLDTYKLNMITDTSSILIIAGVIIGYLLYSIKFKGAECNE